MNNREFMFIVSVRSGYSVLCDGFQMGPDHVKDAVDGATCSEI